LRAKNSSEAVVGELAVANNPGVLSRKGASELSSKFFILTGAVLEVHILASVNVVVVVLISDVENVVDLLEA